MIARCKRTSRINRGRIPAIFTMSFSNFLLVLFASSCGGGLTPEEEMRPLLDIGRAIRGVVDAVQLAFIAVAMAGGLVSVMVAFCALVKNHRSTG